LVQDTKHSYDSYLRRVWYLGCKNKGGKIMPRCPKCYSSDVEEQGGFIAKAFGVGIGILVGALTGDPHKGAHVAGHSLEHGHKYKCNKCGHEFD